MARSITTRSTNPKIMDDNIKILDDALAEASTPPAEDVSYDNTDSGLTATDVQAAIDEIAAISNVTITKNDDYVSSIYLQSCKKVGGVMSLYVVYALGSDIPDDSVLFTISGAIIKGDACTLTISNSGSIQGFLATNATNNTINILHQLGTGTSRFQIVIPCE